MMEWNRQEIILLGDAISKRHGSFRWENKTDRKNLSELWNRHLKSVGITLVRPKSSKFNIIDAQDVVDVINFRNAEVSDALCVMNPDRPAQLLLIPRDVASKILMLGMP